MNGTLHLPHMFLVDSWRQHYSDYLSGVGVREAKFHRENLKMAIANVKAVWQKVLFLQTTAMQAVPLFKDSSLGVVYLDGAHDYCSVRDELEMFWPKLQPGAVLAGDDGQAWHGAQRHRAGLHARRPGVQRLYRGGGEAPPHLARLPAAQHGDLPHVDQGLRKLAPGRAGHGDVEGNARDGRQAEHGGLQRGHRRAGAMDGVSELVEAMEPDGCAPDCITYSTIIKGYCVKGDLEKAFEVFHGMQKNGMAGDSTIYNTVLDGCTRHGRMDLAEELLVDMERFNVVPSNFTLGICEDVWPAPAAGQGLRSGERAAAQVRPRAECTGEHVPHVRVPQQQRRG